MKTRINKNINKQLTLLNCVVRLSLNASRDEIKMETTKQNKCETKYRSVLKVCVAFRVTWRGRCGDWRLILYFLSAPQSATTKLLGSGSCRPITVWSPSANLRRVRRRTHSHLHASMCVLCVCDLRVTCQVGGAVPSLLTGKLWQSV